MMVSGEGDKPELSGGEIELKKRDSHRAIAHPASEQEMMRISGMRRSAGVLISASAATNTPMREKSRWPDAVHRSGWERRVPAKRARPEITRYADTGSRIAMNGGMVSRNIPVR